MKLVAIAGALWLGARGLVMDPLFSAPVEAAYLGFAGDGHIGRYNISHAFYWALGRDSRNPLAGREQDCDLLGAIEVHRPRSRELQAAALAARDARIAELEAELVRAKSALSATA